MPLRIATGEYYESLNRFIQILPPGKDPELIVLKGHLLIERLLEKFLCQKLANPSELDEARLTFAHKISIVAAMHSEPDSKWLWTSIRLLNQLRNELAHQLDNKRYNSLLMKFLDQVESSHEFPNINPPENITDRLHIAIFSVHEAMSHRTDL